MRSPYLFFGLLFLFNTCLSGQLDVKTSPFALIPGGISFGAEFGLTDEIGIELDGLHFDTLFTSLMLNARYYTDVERDLDRFHIGVFAGGQTVDGNKTGLGGGALIGKKWVSRRGIIIEIAGGVGYDFRFGKTMGYGKFHLGYRLVNDGMR